MNNDPAVVLFTYNRPDKTLLVLNHLKSQYDGKLYIYCDGPKNPDDAIMVNKNVQIIDSFVYPDKEIHISDRNLGLANSIIKGISGAFQKERALIIIEDDCVPLPHMVPFLKANLGHWKKRHEVFSISAFHFTDSDVLRSLPYDTFFSKRFLCWGWATWKDRWESVIEELEQKQNPYPSFRAVPDTAGRDLPLHAYNLERRTTDTWAVPLALLTLMKGYKHVMPRYPLTVNVGMDGSGTNCGTIGKQDDIKRVWDGYPDALKFCPAQYKNAVLDQVFCNSMMEPPAWFDDIMKA